MKTWIIGFLTLALGLGAVITADQMGLLRQTAAVPAEAGSSTAAITQEDATGVETADPVDEGPATGIGPVPVGEAQAQAATSARPSPADAAAAPVGGDRLLRAPAVACDKAATPITLGHPGVVQQAGIALAPARPATGSARITATGRIAFPTDRHAQLSSRAAGIVSAVTADLGQQVAAGAVLLRIDSADLGAAVARLRQALAQELRWRRGTERQRQLAADGIGNADDLTTAESSLAQAEAAVAGARQALRNLGLTPAEIAAVAAGEDAAATLELRAPFAGTVIALSAAPGEHCERGERLVTVADTSRVWAMLDLPERDLRHIRQGQAVPVRADIDGGEAVSGTVTWIAPSVDPRTRTVPVRVELDNTEGRFRSGQFVVASIPQRSERDLVLVPREAVQWDGCCNVVFVPGASDRQFETRKVQVDHQDGPLVAIASGIAPGQQVVTSGSWLLKTEILKGSIGAGCCEVH